MRPVDSVVDMIDDLRHERPPYFLADEFAAWIDAMGQTIAMLKKEEQRWACLVLVAQDLCDAMPGLCLSDAYRWTVEHLCISPSTKEYRQ